MWSLRTHSPVSPDKPVERSSLLLSLMIMSSTEPSPFSGSEAGASARIAARLGKNKLNELRGFQIFETFSAKFVKFSAKFVKFSAKFVKFSVKFESMNVQIRNNFKNIIFRASK